MPFLLSDLLTQSAQQYPTLPAISDSNVDMTYAELQRATNKLAYSLLQAGLKPGQRVGIYAPKTVRTVVAILAVLQAGGVYVPLDPKSPAPRIMTICIDCQIEFLFTATTLLPALKSIKTKTTSIHWWGFLDDEVPNAASGWLPSPLCWRDFPDPPRPLARPDNIENDLAYILYTSGSTGVPKGVMLSHRNALAFVEWGKRAFAIQTSDRLANYAPFHFDLSIFDLFVAFASGATLVLVPPEIAAFPYELVRWLARTAITVWYSVPSILKMLLQYGKLETTKLPALRLVLFAGEVFPTRHLQMLMQTLPEAAFCNLYGPTETNVCTYYWVPPSTSLPDDLPIGYACEHSHVFVIQDDGTLAQKIGEEGELCVRGPTVMQGYWQHASGQLSQHPALPDLVGPFYLTGDRVRLGEHGCFLFLGRKDQMIKSRGYRIELGEIEIVLHRHPQIEQAVVVPIPDDMIGFRLEVCYVFNLDQPPIQEEIQRFCAQFLPSYMVPARFHSYLALPKTSTGKVDRTSLRNELLARVK